MNQSCKFLLVSIFISTTFFFPIPQLWANNGEQQIAFSARANAMAGAVTAMPQDATTGLTNPAGLAMLELGEEDIRFDLSLNALNPLSTLNNIYSANDLFILAVGGFVFRSELLTKRLAVGVGAYAVSGGGVDYPAGSYSKSPGFDAPITAVRQSFRIGPSFAYNLSDSLAVGLTTHLTVNQFGVQAPAIKTPTDFALGWTWGLGVVYKVSKKLQFGAAYTAQTNNEALQFTTAKENSFPGCNPCPLTPQQFSLDFQDPQKAALGFAYRPNNNFLIAFDVKWINYRNVRDQWIMNDEFSGDEIVLDLGWEDQLVYALGVDYHLSNKWEVLFGYNYGTSPIDVHDVGRNPGINAIVEHHATVGTAYQISQYSTLNLSYNHGFKNSLSGVRPGTTEPVEVTFETNIFTLQYSHRY